MAVTAKVVREKENGLVHAFKSKVAEHIITEGHRILIENARLIKRISDPRKLEVAERVEVFGPGISFYDYLAQQKRFYFLR